MEAEDMLRQQKEEEKIQDRREAVLLRELMIADTLGNWRINTKHFVVQIDALSPGVCIAQGKDAAASEAEGRRGVSAEAG